MTPALADRLTPGVLVTIAGKRGRFRVQRIEGDTAHVWGGTRNHERSRAFPLDRVSKIIPEKDPRP